MNLENTILAVTHSGTQDGERFRECAYHAQLDARDGYETRRCAHFGDAYISERRDTTERSGPRRWMLRITEAVNQIGVYPYHELVMLDPHDTSKDAEAWTALEGLMLDGAPAGTMFTRFSLDADRDIEAARDRGG